MVTHGVDGFLKNKKRPTLVFVTQIATHYMIQRQYYIINLGTKRIRLL